MNGKRPPGRPRVPSENVGKETVLTAAGGCKSLADALGISKAAVSKWRQIPQARMQAIEELTGIPLHVQRPDLFGE